jgi:hypothetical protein
MVARALTSTITSNRKVFDPTLATYGSYINRPNQQQIQTVTASGLDTVTNITTLESNIVVIQISGI